MTAEQLRNSILQEAISGRLVPQDPNDEPAEIVSTVPEDEIPFEIPASWRWIRMKDCAAIIGGYAFPSASIKGEKGVRVIRISDISEKGFVNKSVVRYNGHENLNKFKIIPQDILIAMTGGTVGKSLFVQQMEEDMLLNQRVAIIRNNGQYAPYIDIVVKSPHIKSFINDKKNSTNDNISMGDINSFLVPLPPLAEQKRIVAKLEELLPVVEQYGKAQKELDELNAALPMRLRNSILQEAMQGKLVPFTAYKETTLGQECEIIMGQSPDGSTYNTLGKGMEFHQGKALFGKMYLNKANVYTSTPLKVAPPDSIVMSVRAPVGTCNLLDRSICIGRGLAAIKPKSEIDLMYLYYLLESKDCLLYLDDHSTGTTFKAVSKKIVEDYAFPLPPLAEQQRIVAKIEELFTQIDKMK